jgi:2-iminobutanoate/2-iminopropanoate deaminase
LSIAARIEAGAAYSIPRRAAYNARAMTRTILLACLLLLSHPVAAQGRQVIVPPGAPKPVGPYSPGILAGDYLYVSGQGVRDADGKMPDGIAAQTRQCLENVKSIVEAAGLTMQHVVHMQLYLERMSDLAEVEKVYAAYFPQAPPARVVLGVAKMPTDTTVEMTAVAVRDLRMKKPLALKNLKPVGHASPAVEVAGRVYFSSVYGQTPAETNQKLKQALKEVGLSERHVVLRNDYGAAATATIPMRELPEQAQSAVSVIAVRKPASQSRAKDAACAADGNTVFCTVQSDAAGKDVQEQVKAVMQHLYAGLERHGAKLSEVTASNVYLDDIREFRPMNETYASFFSTAPPTRTTVQPFAAADRGRVGTPLVRISAVAVKD